jgi:hypothetical protein
MATTPGGTEAAPGLPFSSWGTDLPFNTKLSHPSGVISFTRVGDDGETTSYHVWCEDKTIWSRAAHYYIRLGGASFVFTPMSSPDAWKASTLTASRGSLPISPLHSDSLVSSNQILIPSI